MKSNLNLGKMEQNVVGSKKVFESVMNNRRKEVVCWLLGKYNSLTMQDCEDIVQDACCVLWKKLDVLSSQREEDMVRMWKVISRNTCTHWMQKMRFTDEWNDGKLQYGWEERDFGWDMGDYGKVMKREMMYDYIDNLGDKDRMLMEMVLEKRSMKEIGKELGYGSEAVAKNRKSKIVSWMRRDLKGRDYLEHTSPIAA